MKSQLTTNLDLDEVEQQRLKKLCHYEDEARLQGFQFIAGVDEAGRGPLAGPVVAAACILPAGLYIPKIDDSKQLIPKVRQQLFQRLTTDSSIIYGIGVVDVQKIDQINIYQATIQAMLMAIEKLQVQPDCLLVDGLQLPHPFLPCQKIIKGDALSQSIAAASIIAKETRDAIMREYHKEWPLYGFEQHKGYGTPQHLAAIEKYGICEIHRRSFSPCRSDQIEFEFAEY